MRKTWDKYFMDIADKVAERSTCNRAMVGAVLVKDNKIISTGYNGAPTGEPHCDDIGHLMIEGHCKRTIHAEINAILQAKMDLSGSVLYVTHYPCIDCQKVIKQTCIERVIYKESYGEIKNYFNLNIIKFKG